MGSALYTPLENTHEARAYAYLLRAAVQSVHVRGLKSTKYQLGTCFGRPRRLPCNCLLCIDLSLPPSVQQQTSVIEAALKGAAGATSIEQLHRVSETVRVVALQDRIQLVVLDRSACGHGFSYTANIQLEHLVAVDAKIARHHATLLSSAFAGCVDVGCRGERHLTGWESGLVGFRATLN